jgi:hypothetical protein
VQLIEKVGDNSWTAAYFVTDGTLKSQAEVFECLTFAVDTNAGNIDGDSLKLSSSASNIEAVISLN